jgi:hypothetical protein
VGCGFSLEGWRRQVRLRDWTDEAVAAAHDGLDETRLFRVVAKGLADFADGGIDTVLGVDEDFVAPEALGDLRASDDFAFAFRE